MDKNNVSRLVLVSMVMATAASASAEVKHITPEDVGCDCGESLNRFGVSYRAGFNITGRFRNVHGFTPANNPGPATGSAVDRFYDDGYNRVDESGNAGDLTKFWGYENASQYDSAAFGGNGAITMSSSAAAGRAGTKERDQDPQHGAEITFNRQIGKIGEKVKWGVEAAANYMNLTLRDSSTILGGATKTSDTYALNGVLAPSAPYHAIYGQPSGPLISSIPIRSVTPIPDGAQVSGTRRFDADVFGFRVGPYVEVPICSHFSISLSGGFAAAWLDSDFQFNETLSMSGATPQSSRGKGGHSDWLTGGYAGGNLMVAVNKSVDVFVGAQYQSVGKYSQKENGKEALIDLGNSVFLTAGVGFSF